MNMHRSHAINQQLCNSRFSCSCLRTLSRKAWALSHLPLNPLKLYGGPQWSFRISMIISLIVIYEVLFIVISIYHHNIIFLLLKILPQSSFGFYLQTLVNYLVKKVGQCRRQHNAVVDPLKSDSLGFKS